MTPFLVSFFCTLFGGFVCWLFLQAVREPPTPRPKSFLRIVPIPCYSKQEEHELEETCPHCGEVIRGVAKPQATK